MISMKDIALILAIICFVLFMIWNIWEIICSYRFYKKTNREFKKLIQEIKEKTKEKED